MMTLTLKFKVAFFVGDKETRNMIIIILRIPLLIVIDHLEIEFEI